MSEAKQIFERDGAGPAASWRARPGFVVALLLTWFFVQVISVNPELGMTADELIHVTAGHSYWRTNDYRLQPENGNLPQRIVGLPLLALAPHWPGVGNQAWRRADAWGVGQSFFFHAGNQPGLLLAAGRLMIALLGVLTGGLVYAAARAWFGVGGGLLATALYAANPSLLAHGGLATSDLAAAAGFLATTLTGWRLLHRVSVGRVALFGLALGALALAKFSAPLIGLVLVALVVVRLRRRAALPVRLGSWRWRLRGWRRLFPLGLAGTGGVLLAGGLIWAAYGFRYSTVPRGTTETRLLVSWDLLLGRAPFYLGIPTPTGVERNDLVPVRRDWVRRTVGWTKDHQLLPEAYLYGFLHVYSYSRWRPAFFLGDYGVIGWRAFFPVAFLVKNPLALLALYLLLALVLGRVAWHARASGDWRRPYHLAPLLLLAAVYLGFALNSRLNIGYRHLLPFELVLTVLVGLLAKVVTAGWRRASLGLLVVLVGVAGWRDRPGYLASFNLLAGGPAGAYHLFVDSSLDWGQGLPRLQAWLARHPTREPTYLTYFGSDSPGYQGVRAQRTGDHFFDREPREVPRRLMPGRYVVSATLLHGVYTLTPGRWNHDYEAAYRRLRAEAEGAGRDRLPPGFWLEWDQVRFGRLRHHLLTMEPAARPDPSLLVYELGAADLAEALGW